jgi:two-component system chemotaxis sensor kinase CheA
LLALLLSTDFSTRAQVTQTSGRGVGLSVLAHVVSELSGSLSVESQVGLGTHWKLSFAGVTSHMAAVP